MHEARLKNYLNKVIHLALLLLLAAVLDCQPAVRAAHAQDGASLPSRLNGFDLRSLIIPREHVMSGGVLRDGIMALRMPEVLDPEELAEANFGLQRRGAGLFLTPDQRVVGLSINGQHRAYGLNLLTRHEVINDELGGVPIAVTYCPLCDSALVFDRRVGGEVLEFGVSGLLYSSNLLMYDRSPARGSESLWSQLQARAVSGPHAEAGSTLAMLPALLLSWQDWLELHPDTGVAWRSPDSSYDYSVNPYEEYFREAKLIFPAWPELPDSSPLHAMERIIAVDNGDGWMVFPELQLQRVLSSQSRLELEDVRFSLLEGREGQAPQVICEPQTGRNVRIAYSFWFSWYAMHPDSEIFPLHD